VIDTIRQAARAVAATYRRRLVAAALLGALAATALPPLGLVPLAFVAFPGLILLLNDTRKWRAAGIGGAFGLGFHVVGLYWISSALFVDIARFWWALPFSALGLPLAISIFAALATAAFRAIDPGGLFRPLAFSGCWSAAEWVRGNAFTGFPWNLPAQFWAGAPAMEQTASLVGAYGLSLVTVLALCAPVVLFDREIPRRRALIFVGAFALLVAGLAGWGESRLAGNDHAAVPGVRLRLVQPAISNTDKWDRSRRDETLAKQLAMSVAEPTNGGPAPTHVVWAETAVPFFLEEDARRRSLMGAVVPPGGALITGGPRARGERAEDTTYGNGLMAIDAGGNVVAAYDKAHLVPFGEYVPFRRRLSFIPTLDAGGAEYSPGPGPDTLNVAGLPPFSPLICYEAVFPGKVTDRTGRARWLLNITNDSWYGGSWGPYQHYSIAAMRAIEEGVPLVRVANSGISGVFDAYGNVTSELGLDISGFIDVDLPERTRTETLFTVAGDAPFLFSVAVLIGWPLSRRVARTTGPNRARGDTKGV